MVTLYFVHLILARKLINTGQFYGQSFTTLWHLMVMICILSRITPVDVDLKTVLGILFAAISDGDLEKN